MPKTKCLYWKWEKRIEYTYKGISSHRLLQKLCVEISKLNRGNYKSEAQSNNNRKNQTKKPRKIIIITKTFCLSHATNKWKTLYYDMCAHRYSSIWFLCSFSFSVCVDFIGNSNTNNLLERSHCWWNFAVKIDALIRNPLKHKNTMYCQCGGVQCLQQNDHWLSNVCSLAWCSSLRSYYTVVYCHILHECVYI